MSLSTYTGCMRRRHPPRADNPGVVPSALAVPEGEHLEQLSDGEGYEGCYEWPAGTKHYSSSASHIHVYLQIFQPLLSCIWKVTLEEASYWQSRSLADSQDIS